MNRPIKPVDFVQDYLNSPLPEVVHAKRVKSQANRTVGVTTSASVAMG